MHSAMHFPDSQVVADISSVFPVAVQPGSIAPLVAQARQPASAVQAVHSMQQFVLRHVSHAGLFVVRPLVQMPDEQLVPSQLDFAQPMRACASLTPAEWSVWHFIRQAASAQACKQSSSVPQSVPVSHAAISAQHDMSMQSWHVASLLHVSPPQLAAPPAPVVAPVVFDPVVFDPVVFDPVVFEPVVFEPVVFEPVVTAAPPVPPLLSPVVVPVVAGLLPHAAAANIETTTAQYAQDFMLMPPTTRDVRSWSPPV